MKTMSTSALLKISFGSVVALGMWYFAAQCSAFLKDDACQPCRWIIAVAKHMQTFLDRSQIAVIS